MHPRTRLTVCSDCLSLLRRPRTSHIRLPAQSPWNYCSFGTASCQPRAHRSTRAQNAGIRQIRHLAAQAAQQQQPPAPYQAADLTSIHNRVQELARSVLKPDDGKIPAEERILYVLEQLEYLAKLILDERVASEPSTSTRQKPISRTQQKASATSALLGSVNARAYPVSITRASILSSISEKAEEIVRHPDVFISPGVLKAYVSLQSLLHQPSSFPDVFDLYARKAIPIQKGNTITYSSASPDQIKSAVPGETAKAALHAAIEAHDLPLAVDIISTTYCTPAFKKAKTFRQAAFPIVGLGVAPLAALTLSTTFANLQQTMDTSMATGIAFAGTMTYVGAVAMVGYVAVTTANDQMDRVVWASGVPLWERWVREDERAAIDRVAGAWGFKEVDKRGEEEGEDWEALREWIGSRGMVLDKVSLMEGME
ncbi:uncharacterized protein MYCFIDRAFT_210008 [Pseudocercospora fijiensis CIRAD86]|uniref:Uncharacterized protein n=1 Tax=Pseudocercospora fijiensis (strain CIRAD86) TaxID=383855 RepID=N1QB10_PSEFD|nr:uncharacterized protein MYCFIDRAFT_210008 [Pseudocercospora fijiensis CIRAD86]EME89161.1 hypothetical protein MYCFIDRAFT_210008 [Pseudocercospora fijiensis CIRAD86]